MDVIKEVLKTFDFTGAALYTTVGMAVFTFIRFYSSFKQFKITMNMESDDNNNTPSPSVDSQTNSTQNNVEVTSEAPKDKQYRLLEKYHGQVIMHSNFSFWFSLVFACLGFIIILTSIYSFVESGSILDQGPAIIKVISGSIINGVSALLFVQSNKMRDSMTDFFDKLRTDRKLEESLKLIESIKDPDIQDRLRTVVAMEFVEIKTSDDFMKSFLDKSKINE